MTEREILKWLNEHCTELHTTGSLATHFHVTPRTIQNYLRAMKDRYSDYIEITRKGIRVKKTIPLEASDFVPSTYKERKHYILRKLLVSDASVDMDWLAGRLCISEITLQNEIKRIRRSLEKSRLVLKTKNNRLFITGDIEDKKALMIREIYEEAQKYLVSLDTLDEIFPRFQVREIRGIILEKLHEKQFYMDEYSLVNLLLHILIAMDESCAAPAVSCQMEETVDFSQLNRHFVTMVDDICKVLEHIYGMTFSDSSKYQFNLLCMTRAIRNKEFMQMEGVSLSISAENAQLVSDILRLVYDTYNIDLNEMEFVVAFSLHIQNMLIRLRQKIIIHNPLLYNIKMTAPFIYDIGIYISNFIQKRCHVDIYEDEIAYIALHVGARIEEINRTKGKLRMVLVCPQYYSYPNRQFDRLMACFQEEIVLEGIVTNPAEAGESDCDLIISTVPVSVTADWILISNFFSLADREAVGRVIQKIRRDKERGQIAAVLRRMIRRELFCANAVYFSREDAMRQMGGQMIEAGLVSDEFIERLREREQISPSNFDMIAIPHPIDYYARESAISVSLLREALPWGNSQVEIIFMLTVSRQDLADYSNVFSFLAGICNNGCNLKLLLQCEDYDAFMDRLLSLG